MRSVFVSTAGFLGRIDSDTRCAFWADEPVDHDFDASRLITIDLARNPSAAAAGRISWDAVEVDDCFVGPNGDLIGTTLGQRWPELQIAGLVCLEQSFRDRLPAELRPPCPPLGVSGRDYEFMSVVYWPGTGDSRAGNRYSGHHARIVDHVGRLARVEIFPPTASTNPAARPVRMWVDLSAPDQCDAGSNPLTEIAVDGAKEGALFLLAGTLKTTND